MVVERRTIPQDECGIIVIHENEKWMEPLRAAFEAQGIEFEEWDLGKGGEVDLSSIPPNAVFYNRMSASSHTRGHRFAIEHTHAVLEWLELHGRRVINGSKALLQEMSKVRQYAALQKLQIRTPRTVCVTGSCDDDEERKNFIEKLIRSARQHFDNVPFISKHNRSGRGVGVRLWKDMIYFEKYLQDQFQYETPVDGMMLLQQYIASPEPFITRVEIVGGKFLYAVRVNTSDGFELCPADNCSIVQNFKTNFEILPGFETTHSALVAQFEEYCRAVDAEVCGIEFVTDAKGTAWTYDVNMNTNYNPAAERNFFGKPCAMPAIAAFLEKTRSSQATIEASPLALAKKCDIECCCINKTTEKWAVNVLVNKMLKAIVWAFSEKELVIQTMPS